MKDPGLFAHLADPPQMASWLAWLGLTASAAALAVAACVPAAQRWLYPPVRQSRFRDQILFEEVLEDGETIRCADGSLVVVVALAGRDLSSLPDERWSDLFNARKRWLEAIGALGGVRMISVTTRRYHDDRDDVEGYDNPVLRELMEAWQKGFGASFRNAHFVVFWVRGGSHAARARLRAAVKETRETLRDYHPYVLKAGRPDDPSPLLGFWASLLNPMRSVRMVNVGSAANPVHLPNFARASMQESDGLDRRLAELVAGANVSFSDGGEDAEEDGIITFRDGPRKAYMAGLGVAKWGNETSERILQRVSSMACEMFIVQWIDVIDPIAAEAYLVDKRNKDGTFRLGGASREMEFQAGFELLGSGAGHQDLAAHEGVIFVLAASRQELERNVEDVRHAFGQHEGNAVRFGAEVQLKYYAMFPAHKDTLQLNRLFTANVAHLVAFDTPEQGLAGCDWGPRPVTKFPTMAASPYSLTWHRSPAALDVGHTVVVGSTGAGKTTVMSFLGLCSLGYDNLHTFIFDRKEGAYVPVTACGGSYITIASDADAIDGVASLNPFQQEGFRPSAHGGGPFEWSLRWLRDHVACDADAEGALETALRAMTELAPSERGMTELYKSLPADMPGYENVRRFAEGQYRYLFNGTRDTFTTDRLVGIDFTQALEDETLVRALLPYLTYRIRSAMVRRNAPYLMIVDETQPLLRNPAVRDWFRGEMQEARKQRGVVVSCFQRVDALREEGVLSLLVGQSANVIAFPEPTASPHDYMEGLRFSQQAFDAIRGKHPLTEGRSRYAVIRRDDGSEIILNVDLGPALGGGLLKLLGSGPGPAAEARRLRKQFPDDWAWRLIGQPDRHRTGRKADAA